MATNHKEAEVVDVSVEDTTKEITSSALDITVDRMHAHFNHDGKKWTINPDNIPSLEQANQIAKDIVGLQLATEYLENETSWLLGNLISETKKVYGDDFDVSELEGVTHRSFQTLRTSEAVYNAYADCRIPGMSFTHHKEVFYVKGLDDEAKLLILHKAREMSLSALQTSELAKLVAKDGKDVLTGGDTQLGLMNKIQEKKDTEPVYIIVSFNGIVKKVKEHGFTEEMDSSSQIIIQIHPDMELLKKAPDHKVTI